jgi:hypothetical protein
MFAFGSISEDVSFFVTIQHNHHKDLDADFRRHDEPGNGLSGCVIPAKAGIQCWRMAIHRMY